MFKVAYHRLCSFEVIWLVPPVFILSPILHPLLSSKEKKGLLSRPHSATLIKHCDSISETRLTSRNLQSQYISELATLLSSNLEIIKLAAKMEK